MNINIDQKKILKSINSCQFSKLSKNQELHQTKMMFNLIEECNIKYSHNVSIDMDLPLKKLIFLNPTPAETSPEKPIYIVRD